MVILHHDLSIELPDEWWAEAGMCAFQPTSSAYRVAPVREAESAIYLLPINNVEPVRRAPGVEIFASNERYTARDRVVQILRGFRAGDQIPPVELKRSDSPSKRAVVLNGTHRLYCSLAAGYTHIPAVDGWVPEVAVRACV